MNYQLDVTINSAEYNLILLKLQNMKKGIEIYRLSQYLKY